MKTIVKLICFLVYLQLIQSSDVCEKLPPGLQRMTRGIDITALDLFPTDLAHSNGFQRSLFKLSCTKGRKWTHPFDSTLVFDIPDQIDTINTLPGGVMNTKTTISESVTDFKKSMSVDVGLGINTVAYGAYSASGSYKKAQQELSNSTKSIVQVSAYVSAVQMDFNPYYDMKADEYFTQFVDTLLPEKYETNPQKYQEFVETFGTHYFDSGFFGGFLQQTIEMTSNLNLKLTEQEIKINAEASFLTVVKLNGGYNGENKKVSEVFDKNTQTYTSYFGGKSNLMKPGGWADWWESVPRDPWLFGGNLKPIEDLITSNKKAQVSEAVRIKLDKAFLNDMKNSLTLFSRFAKISAENELQMIEKLVTQVMPSHSEVLKVKEVVDIFVAKETAVLDKMHLTELHKEIQSLEDYELFCKQIVAQKCMNDHLREVNLSIDYGKDLIKSVDELKSQNMPNREEFKELSRKVQRFLWDEKLKRIGECQEKLFCNLCKIVEIDITHKSKCDTTDIKHLLNIAV